MRHFFLSHPSGYHLWHLLVRWVVNISLQSTSHRSHSFPLSFISFFIRTIRRASKAIKSGQGWRTLWWIVFEIRTQRWMQAGLTFITTDMPGVIQLAIHPFRTASSGHISKAPTVKAWRSWHSLGTKIVSLNFHLSSMTSPRRFLRSSLMKIN